MCLTVIIPVRDHWQQRSQRFCDFAVRPAFKSIHIQGTVNSQLFMLIEVQIIHLIYN